MDAREISRDAAIDALRELDRRGYELTPRVRVEVHEHRVGGHSEVRIQQHCIAPVLCGMHPPTRMGPVDLIIPPRSSNPSPLCRPVRTGA
jgi:hypothetical protein